MNENMNRFAFNTEGKICDYGYEEPKVLTEQEILEELNHLENTKNHFWEECEDVNWQNECLQEELDKAIVPKFKVGDYFIEYWNKELNIYQYQGDKHFKCLNKKQGYHCDYVVLGALLLEEDFIQPISKEEARAKLKEMQNENIK